MALSQRAGQVAQFFLRSQRLSESGCDYCRNPFFAAIPGLSESGCNYCGTFSVQQVLDMLSQSQLNQLKTGDLLCRPPALINAGCSCFINAVVQALWALPLVKEAMKDFLLNRMPPSDGPSLSACITSFGCDVPTVFFWRRCHCCASRFVVGRVLHAGRSRGCA